MAIFLELIIILTELLDIFRTSIKIDHYMERITILSGEILKKSWMGSQVPRQQYHSKDSKPYLKKIVNANKVKR